MCTDTHTRARAHTHTHIHTWAAFKRLLLSGDGSARRWVDEFARGKADRKRAKRLRRRAAAGERRRAEKKTKLAPRLQNGQACSGANAASEACGKEEEERDVIKDLELTTVFGLN